MHSTDGIQVFMGQIKTAQNLPNYGLIGETNRVFEVMSLVLTAPSKNSSRAFVHG